MQVNIGGEPVTIGSGLLSDAIRAALGGGLLELPPGQFVFDRLDLSGVQNLTVRGSGKGATTIRPHSTTGPAILLDGARGVSFEDMTISPATQDRREGAMFSAHGASGLAFRRLQVGAFWTGWRLTGTSDVTWENVRMVDYGQAPLLYGVHASEGCSSLWFDRTYLQSSAQQGAVGYRFEGVDTIGMNRSGVQKFNQATLGGVEIANGAQWQHFTDCFFEVGKAGGAGVKVEGLAYGVQLTACHMVTGRYGLHLAPDANGAGPRHVRVTGGRASFNGEHGVFVEAGSAWLSGVDLSNNSMNADGQFDAVHNAGGTVTARDCRIGTFDIPVAGGGSRHRYGFHGQVTDDGNDVSDCVAGRKSSLV